MQFYSSFKPKKYSFSVKKQIFERGLCPRHFSHPMRKAVFIAYALVRAFLSQTFD